MQAHDTKTNIRKNSLFAVINVPLPILYFLTFFCFAGQSLIVKAFIEANDNRYLFVVKTSIGPKILKFIL